MQADPLGPAGLAGQKVDAGDGGDGGQRLAPKAQRVDAVQILGGGNFAGGVPQKCRLGVLRRHAAAVVGDPNKGDAAVLDLDGHSGCARVNGVFRELFYHRAGPLDDFAGGDQIRHMGRKLVDFCRKGHLPWMVRSVESPK